MANLFDDREAPRTGETFNDLLAHKNIRIERIVSSAEPDHKEYDQDHDEWVVLLKGGATLAIDGEDVSLEPGDYLFIPRHTVHRVMRTKRGTVWLAVHIGDA